MPAPISRTALSIKLTCCWLFSKKWHKATLWKHTFIKTLINKQPFLLYTYPGPYQCPICINGLSDADVMTYKTEGLLPQWVEHTGLPVVPPAQSFHSHQLLCWRKSTFTHTVYCALLCTMKWYSVPSSEVFCSAWCFLSWGLSFFEKVSIIC